MELFTRANLGPDYNTEEWCDLYRVSTKTSGAMMFNFGVTNTSGVEVTTEESNISVLARVIDGDGNIVAYITMSQLGPKSSILFENKIVLNPGDTIQVMASSKGCVFYASITTNVKVA